MTESIFQPCQNSSMHGLSKRRRSMVSSDSVEVLALKDAFHLSLAPEKLLCREVEFDKVMKFCTDCILSNKAKSLYICGSPGSGKSVTMEKVMQQIMDCAREAGVEAPKVALVNCSSLSNPRDIYCRVLHSLQPRQPHTNSENSYSYCLKEIKKRICKSTKSSKSSKYSSKRMCLLVVDEIDFLIKKEQSILYELFRLSSYQGSCCILIGISNAIDLTDRLLPNLSSLQCEPEVITFPAYGKDQILTILRQRLENINLNAFQSFALELCARKVAAAAGDMRKALDLCRIAVEISEKEEGEVKSNMDQISKLQKEKAVDYKKMKLMSTGTAHAIVHVDHMAKALARTFKSPVVEMIQALPQHSQMVLCSAVQLFRKGRKDSSLGELNKAYLEFCKANTMHALAPPEFSSVCRVLADQALLSLGTAREDRLKRVTLHVNEADIAFSLQGVRFFRNSLG